MYIDGLWISNRAGVRLTSVVVVIPTQVYKATVFVKKKSKKRNRSIIVIPQRRGGVEMWVTLARTMSFRLQSASDLSSETTIPHTYYPSAINNNNTYRRRRCAADRSVSIYRYHATDGEID